MATRKRKRKSSGTRRRKRTMSENFPLSKRGSRRRRRSKKTGLSEIFTPAGFKEGGKTAISGALGGGVSFLVDMLVPKSNQGLRAIAQLGTAIVLAGGFQMPNMGAGVMGAYANNMANGLYTKTLNEMEEEEFADEDALDEYPDALDEDGNPMYLADNGNFYYLEEFELAEDGNYYLSEDMQANLYPGYINPSI